MDQVLGEKVHMDNFTTHVDWVRKTKTVRTNVHHQGPGLCDRDRAENWSISTDQVLNNVHTDNISTHADLVQGTKSMRTTGQPMWTGSGGQVGSDNWSSYVDWVARTRPHGQPPPTLSRRRSPCGKQLTHAYWVWDNLVQITGRPTETRSMRTGQTGQLVQETKPAWTTG